MTIVTRRRTSDFTTVPNEIANDSALSFAARGLLIYLLSKPDQWGVNITDIRREGGIGRDAVYKLLRELKERGYIVAEDTRTDGRFNSINYTVYDCLQNAHTANPIASEIQERLRKVTNNENNVLDNETPLTENPYTVENQPHTEKPYTVNPDTEKPYTVNPDAIIRTKINKNISPQTPQSLDQVDRTTWGRGTRAGKQEAEALFDQLWTLWPENLLPNTKAIAASRFKKLTADEQDQAVQHAADFLRVCDRDKRTALMIPYLDEKAFEKFVGGPNVDENGYFVIKRNTPEWDAWKEWFASNHGPDSARRMTTMPSLQRATRYPVGYAPKETRQ